MRKQKGEGIIMKETEKIMELEAELSKLKEENDMLINIVAQMRITLDRLINRCMTDNHHSKTSA